MFRARRRIRGIQVEGGGEAIYLGKLSPGCRACKEGTWDCIFTTMRCNLDCEFCCSPHGVPPGYAGSAFGTTPEEITANHARTRISGISFSGGEPFVEVNGLLDWVAWFAHRFPDKYTWVYTNGLLADETSLCKLGELGVDEIRFNVAATGYDHATVLGNMATAARYIPRVTVEIPAIPNDAGRLLSSLTRWAESGVKFLNLHELMYEPGTNSASMPGPRQSLVTLDGHRTDVHPRSRALTLAVMQRVQEEGLPLSVNDCSMQSKLRQLRGRRRSLAPLTRAPHERQLADGSYASYCTYSGDDAQFFHPDSFDEMRRRQPDRPVIRLVRTAPLSLADEGRWIVFDEVGRSDG